MLLCLLKVLGFKKFGKNFRYPAAESTDSFSHDVKMTDRTPAPIALVFVLLGTSFQRLQLDSRQFILEVWV